MHYGIMPKCFNILDVSQMYRDKGSIDLKCKAVCCRIGNGGIHCFKEIPLRNRLLKIPDCNPIPLQCVGIAFCGENDNRGIGHRNQLLCHSKSSRWFHLDIQNCNIEAGCFRSIQQIFGVKVSKVNTVRMQGKAKRTGAYPVGKRPEYKKTIVTLTADSKTIEFFEGMA